MKKTKVLHVVGALKIGGVEQFLLTLIKNWDRRKYDLEICCAVEKGEFASEFEKLGVPVWIANYNPRRKLRSIIQLRDNLKGRMIDIVHCSSYGLHVSVLAAAKLAGIPGFLTSIQGVQQYKGITQIRNKSVFAIASRFIDYEVAGAKEIEDSVRSYVSQGKLSCIYNGVDTTRFYPGISQNRSKLFGSYIDPRETIITMISRLDKFKDHELFLRAADKVKHICPQTKFVIVGSGSPESYLKDLAGELGLNKHVLFLGTRIDTPEILRASDIFAFAATEEGGMNVCLMEAMASGKPCVVAGLREGVEHGVGGYSFGVGDLNGFADALITLVQEPEIRIRMGENACLRARQRFSINNIVKQYENIYQRIERRIG
jgi:glycosyltransferase involved in cell wall biosynthesis